MPFSLLLARIGIRRAPFPNDNLGNVGVVGVRVTSQYACFSQPDFRSSTIPPDDEALTGLLLPQVEIGAR